MMLSKGGGSIRPDISTHLLFPLLTVLQPYGLFFPHSEPLHWLFPLLGNHCPGCLYSYLLLINQVSILISSEPLYPTPPH